MKPTIPPLREFPEPLAAALGHLLVRFQALETTLLFAVGRFVHPGIEGVPPALTIALLQELPFKSLVALFSIIPRMLSENEPPFPKISMTDPAVIEAAEAFTVAAKQCNKVEQRRNQLVHSNWLQLQIGPEEGSIHRVKARTSRRKGVDQSLKMREPEVGRGLYRGSQSGHASRLHGLSPIKFAHRSHACGLIG